MDRTYAELDPPVRVLMGPGPSNVPPRVYRALAAPVVGHLDPAYVALMEDSKALLREVFQTANRLTIPMSGTGSAGMETCLVNLVEPGDRVLICVNGVFGRRMCDVAQRCGAQVTPVEAEWGEAIDATQVAAALRSGTYKLVGVVHAETSTGVLQPLDDIVRLAHEHGALVLVDTVTSLGGVEVAVDRWHLDLCYSGTQKCLSCPPGLAPVTISEECLEVVRRRRTKVQSWYLDLSLIEQYWGEERVYHHTAPISMNYALREALLSIHEEGLERRWGRHLRAHRALVRGLEAMGLRMAVAPAHRLPTLNTVSIPSGVDDGAVRRHLLEQFNLEIGGGLGALRGKTWRVGLMGYTARLENVVYFLAALEAALATQGYGVPRGAGAQAALREE